MCSHRYSAAVDAETKKATEDQNLADYESVITDLSTLAGNATKYIIYMYHLAKCMDDLIINGGPFDKGKVRETRNELITARNTLYDILAAVRAEKKKIEDRIESLQYIIDKKYTDCYYCIQARQEQKGIYVTAK